MNYKACVEFSLTVLPQSPILFQPCKRPFYNPALRNHNEHKQLVPLGDLYCRAKYAQDLVGKWLTCITAISQYILHGL